MKAERRMGRAGGRVAWACPSWRGRAAAVDEAAIEDVDGLEFARTRLGFVPDARQADLLAGEHHRLVLNCTRQWGKSTVTAG